MDLNTNLEDAEVIHNYLDNWVFQRLREELRLGYVAAFDKARGNGENKYLFLVTADRSEFPRIKEEIEKKLANLSDGFNYAEAKKTAIKNIRKTFEVIANKNASSKMMTLLLGIDKAKNFNYFYNRYTSDLITEENRQKYNKPYDIFFKWLEATPETDMARDGRGWKSIDQIGKEMLDSIQYIYTYDEKEGDDNIVE